MNWQTLIPIIIQYGFPVAEALWKLFTTNATPTQVDWDNLKTLASVGARQNMLAALQRAGIDAESPQGQALLALTPA